MLKIPHFGLCIGVIVGVETLFFVLTLYLAHKEKSRTPKSAAKSIIRQVLFFPDSGLGCKYYSRNSQICPNSSCKFLHEETSLLRLIRHLQSAESSLELCLFLFTNWELGEAVIDLHRKGVRVLLITDSSESDEGESQVGRFRAEGIAVRCHKSTFLMHHKFALVDRRILVNGSFNWTRQAVLGNHENILVTNEQEIVAPFVEEFTRLWTSFNPDTK